MSPPPPSARFRSCFCRPGSTWCCFHLRMGSGGGGGVPPLWMWRLLPRKLLSFVTSGCQDCHQRRCLLFSQLLSPEHADVHSFPPSEPSPCHQSWPWTLCQEGDMLVSEHPPQWAASSPSQFRDTPKPGRVPVPDLALVAFTAQASCKQGPELRLEGTPGRGSSTRGSVTSGCHSSQLPRVRSPAPRSGPGLSMPSWDTRTDGHCSWLRPLQFPLGHWCEHAEADVL